MVGLSGVRCGAVCKCLYIVQQQTEADRRGAVVSCILEVQMAPGLLLFPLSTYHVYFFPFAQEHTQKIPKKPTRQSGQASRQANMQQIFIQNTHANFSNSQSEGAGIGKWR